MEASGAVSGAGVSEEGVCRLSGPFPCPQCITDVAREQGISSSLQLPDRVLHFLKDHFLMDGQVRSRLLLQQSHARYQRVAVHRVAGLHHTYDVLFLGTGECRGKREFGETGQSGAGAGEDMAVARA